MSYLTIEQVCNTLAEAGVDQATLSKVFSARLQPQNLDDQDRKFVMGVPDGLGNAYLVVYKFGLGRPLVKNSPLDESGPDWRPRWVSVEGPFDAEDTETLNTKARELTSG